MGRIELNWQIAATGEGDWLVVWRDPTTVRYLGWVFSGRHRAVGDATLSRMVWAVRVLFLIALPAILAMFASLPLINR